MKTSYFRIFFCRSDDASEIFKRKFVAYIFHYDDCMSYEFSK